MSKSQNRFMQSMARNSKRLVVSALGVDRDLDKKIARPSHKKARRSASRPKGGHGMPSLSIKLVVRALLEAERFIGSGRPTDPPSVTRTAMIVCANWFRAASTARVRWLLFPGLTDRERSQCARAFGEWLKATARHKGNTGPLKMILESGKVVISPRSRKDFPQPAQQLKSAVWWIRTAIIRVIAETKGEGWTAMPPKPGTPAAIQAVSKPGRAVMVASDPIGILVAVENPFSIAIEDAGEEDVADTEDEGSGESADEEPPSADAAQDSIVRAEYGRLKLERANAEHARVATALVAYLEERGWITEQEVDGIDVLGARGAGEDIFEVKSITPDNETGQVRAGIAQLLEYRWKTGRPSASLWLVLSGRPAQAWLAAFLADVGIGLLWVGADGAVSGPALGTLESIAAMAP